MRIIVCIAIYIYYKMNKRSQLSVLNGREKYLALQNECSSSSDTESESEESCFVTTKINKWSHPMGESANITP